VQTHQQLPLGSSKHPQEHTVALLSIEALDFTSLMGKDRRSLGTSPALSPSQVHSMIGGSNLQRENACYSSAEAVVLLSLKKAGHVHSQNQLL
jgi:hypothetical protein